jgi:hypothetical protein
LTLLVGCAYLITHSLEDSMTGQPEEEARQLGCPFALTPPEARDLFYKCEGRRCMAWDQLTADSGYCRLIGEYKDEV